MYMFCSMYLLIYLFYHQDGMYVFDVGGSYHLHGFFEYLYFLICGGAFRRLNGSL
jgi:hypothetical protein